ncbi:phosphopentomutase [Amaricoccus macauensis]|uniref:Phosphopentomutase n=1 Tax=Amaricoccus macauensis TaxID=57001 RepID=A0A840SU90_9RHOB|nr:phosphopentomutase [Amaricoccus macauensis]MBB5223396.1 phosphopentomutase [Amaricoccus macauensis]
MSNTRAVLIVLDSVGVGGADDAHRYGDAGSNTLGHIVQAADEGRADIPGGRKGPLHLPHLARLGLFDALHLASGRPAMPVSETGTWGVGIERSPGKDTTSGHWEIAGTPVRKDFHYFPVEEPAFPPELIAEIVARAGLPGVLGNRHGSGTRIIEELGDEHARSGKPIFYTSADSVVQIAAHEVHFGLDRLYDLCVLTRELVDPLMVGRVIARPFTGETPSFTRTANRRDYSMPPFDPTLLDTLVAEGRSVIGVGKISDIFAGRGISQSRKASGIEGTALATAEAIRDLPEGGLVFSNVVEFDSEFGHRRNVAGYAAALETFDALVPAILGELRRDDLLIITADHGNDPTWRGTDHTRERTPILVTGPAARPGCIGLRDFSDIAATIAAHLGVSAPIGGSSFDWKGESTNVRHK